MALKSQMQLICFRYTFHLDGIFVCNSDIFKKFNTEHALFFYGMGCVNALCNPG